MQAISYTKAIEPFESQHRPSVEIFRFIPLDNRNTYPLINEYFQIADDFMYKQITAITNVQNPLFELYIIRNPALLLFNLNTCSLLST